MIIWYVDPPHPIEGYRVYIEPVKGLLQFRPMTFEEGLAKPLMEYVHSSADLVRLMARLADKCDLTPEEHHQQACREWGRPKAQA